MIIEKIEKYRDGGTIEITVIGLHNYEFPLNMIEGSHLIDFIKCTIIRDFSIKTNSGKYYLNANGNKIEIPEWSPFFYVLIKEVKRYEENIKMMVNDFIK